MVASQRDEYQGLCTEKGIVQRGSVGGVAGKRLQGNQYAVTEYYTPVHKGDTHMPAVWFVYDISPINVSISRTRRSLTHLLVRCCAVVGGVFAVTGAGPGLCFSR